MIEATVVPATTSIVTYIGYPSGTTRPGETVTIPVALRNHDTDLWPATGERAVKLSKDKYCSATIMLAKTAAITYDIVLVEGDRIPDPGATD